MGALTITERKAPQFVGNQKVVTMIGTPSTSYATAGETITLAALGLSRLDHLEVQPAGTSTGTTGYVCRWNGSRTAPTVLYYGGAASGSPLAEETAADNLSTFPVRIKAVGA